MATPAAIILALGGKGKGMSKGTPMSKPTEEQEGSDEPDYKQLYVDACKDGDWEAAFDAMAQHCGAMGVTESETEEDEA